VSRLLREPEVRLVTLAGPGGTGKTRLALQGGAELLSDFTSGVFFVALASIRDPALVTPAIAQALAVREVPGEHLSGHANCIPRAETDAACARQLRTGHCRGCRCCSASRPMRSRQGTSDKPRAAAASRGEGYEVPALTLPDQAADVKGVLANEAGALFVERATAAAPSFALDRENAPVVAAICQRLEGLPLAIELAAARMVSLTPGALLRRLEQRLSVLTSGARDVDSRQRTLRQTIDWSYQLLTEGQRSLFAELAIFSCGGRLEAVEAICAEGSADRLDLIDSLVAKRASSCRAPTSTLSRDSGCSTRCANTRSSGWASGESRSRVSTLGTTARRSPLRARSSSHGICRARRSHSIPMNRTFVPPSTIS
jgi:predicted ATPase